MANLQVNNVIRLHHSRRFSNRPEVVDQIIDLMTEYDYSISYVSNKSGVCRLTLKNWFSGKTTRPLSSTLNAVAKVFNHKLALVKL